MKAIICSNALNTYPDYTKPFHRYTDASNLQIGSAIIQVHNNNPCPISYYSKKLNSSQINYTTTKKELLDGVITFKEYSKILSGAVCFLYIDHKNLNFITFRIQWVLRWRLYLDRFDWTLCYIEGKLNVLVDWFSILPRMEKPSGGDREQQSKCGTTIDF